MSGLVKFPATADADVLRVGASVLVHHEAATPRARDVIAGQRAALIVKNGCHDTTLAGVA